MYFTSVACNVLELESYIFIFYNYHLSNSLLLSYVVDVYVTIIPGVVWKTWQVKPDQCIGKPISSILGSIQPNYWVFLDAPSEWHVFARQEKLRQLFNFCFWTWTWLTLFFKNPLHDHSLNRWFSKYWFWAFRETKYCKFYV